MNDDFQIDRRQLDRTVECLIGTTLKHARICCNFRQFRWWVPLHAFLLCLLVQVIFYPGPTYAREVFVAMETLDMNIVPKESNILQPTLVTERARSAIVGTIMALLATFDEAGILPPEGTAQANQVIHALIQIQSTFLKSPSPEIADYWAAANADWEHYHEEKTPMPKREEGLTEQALAVLVAYDQKQKLWEKPNVASALQAFNVSRADWELVTELYRKAKAIFHEQGRSIEMVYKNWQMKVLEGKFSGK